MKEPRAGYFSEMNRITQRLWECAQKDPAYLSEYSASKQIDEMILDQSKSVSEKFEEIMRLVIAVEAVEHANGSAWHDYKIHLAGTLRINGIENIAL